MNFRKHTIILVLIINILVIGSTKLVAADDFIVSGNLEQSSGKTTVTNRYIVKVKEGLKPNLKVADFKLVGKSNSEKFMYVELQKDEKNKSRVITTLENESWVEYVVPDNRLTLFTTPNDASFGLQWSHRNTGQSVLGVFGTNDMDVDSEQAWTLEQNSLESAIVGVIDTGVTFAHPDLASNLVPGWDFIDNDNAPYDYTYDEVTNYPYTTLSHGSHVSGIISSVTNNSIGIAGVSYNNDVKVMPLRVDLSVSQIVSAIEYADLAGVKILNGSFGTPAGDPSVTFEGYLPMYEAIRDYSGIFVAAAGNSAANIDIYPVYPASYDLANLVTVGAIASNGSRASYSNYGVVGVDVYAPGSSMLSTVPIFTTDADEYFEDSTVGTNFSTTIFTVNSGAWAITEPSSGELMLSVNSTNTYQNNANQSITLTTPLDANDVAVPANLYFYIYGNIQYLGGNCVDYLSVSIDNNDNNWTEVTKLCGTFNEYVNINLNSVNPLLRIRFTWVTDGSVTGIAPLIDDIQLRTYGGVNNTYAYMSGTSMASPLVAGQIGLLKSQYPAVSNADLIDEIKASRVNTVTNSYNYLANGLIDWGSWNQSEGRSPNGVATYNYNTRLYQSVGGNNGFIYLRTKDEGQAWSGWSEFGGYTYSNPDFEEFDGCLYLNVRGRDNGIYIRRTCDGTTWNKWASFGGSTYDGPVLESHGSTLFQSARGRDNTIYIRSSSDGITWGVWYAPGGATSASPSLISYDGVLTQFVKGASSNSVWTRAYISGNSWTGWEYSGFDSVCPVAFEVFNSRLYQSYCRPSDTNILVRSIAPEQEWTVALDSQGRSQKTPSIVFHEGNLQQYVSGNNTNIYMRYGLNRLISGVGSN